MSDLRSRLERLEARGQRAQPIYRPLTPDEVEAEATAVLAAEQAFLTAVEEGRGEAALQEAEAAYLRISKVDSLRYFPDGDIARVMAALEVMAARERATPQ